MAHRVDVRLNLDARSIAWDNDHGERFLRGEGEVRATQDADQGGAGSIESGSVCGEVLVAVDNPFVSVEAGGGLDTGGRVAGVEVRAAGRFGEGPRREEWFAPGEGGQELGLLFRGSKVDDRLES